MSTLIKMKVLFLDHFYCHGGAQEYIVDLANCLSGFPDIECHIPKIPIPALNNPSPNIKIANISLLNKSRVALFFLKFIINVFQLRLYIKKNNIEIIHCNNVPVMILAKIVVISIKKRKIFFSVHDFITSPIKHRLIQFCSDKIIAVSDAIKKSIAQKAIVKNEIRVIYNGFDITKFSHLPYQKRQAICFGMVCRIIPWKGVDLFISAAKTILQINKNVTFIIYGNYEDTKYREYIKSLLHGFEMSIIEKPFEKNKETIYRSFDILVNTAIGPEPFGRTLVEAGLFGLPVIGPDTAGPKEIIKNGITGSTFETNNCESLVACMMQYVDNFALIKQQGLKNREYCAVTFSIEKLSKKILDYYKNLS